MSQPLDPAKALFYGQFVQTAYAMYKRDPANLRPEPQAGDIPAGYELAAWIHMSDFFLSLEQPKFYGIVARDQANPQSRVIAIRGTEGAVEWIDDAFAIPVPFRQVPSAGRVAGGFDKIYSTLKVVKHPLPGDARPALMAAVTAGAAPAAAAETFAGSFAEQLEQLALSREPLRAMALTGAVTRPERPMVVTGHSLGSALCTLFVLENDSKGKFDITTLCTFASPRVGNQEFCRTFDLLPIDSWRVVNTLDIVPKLPPHIPVVLDYDHVNTAYPFTSSSFARNSLACWHAMETYLHWLDANQKLLSECVP
jgi:hypothetical protein